MSKITLTLYSEGQTEIEVDHAEYEAAKAAGDLAEFLDVYTSDIETDETVQEPDGTVITLPEGNILPPPPAPDPAAEYMVAFNEFWREEVTDDDGALDLDKVARELADYRALIEESGKVYLELTGGAFSKPNTSAAYIIERADERYAEDYAERLLDAMESIVDFDPDAAARAEIVELADSWSPGAWDRHEDLVAQRAEVAARFALKGGV